jgi:hypothetical protein
VARSGSPIPGPCSTEGLCGAAPGVAVETRVPGATNGPGEHGFRHAKSISYDAKTPSASGHEGRRSPSRQLGREVPPLDANRHLSGEAGEHWVLYKLLRRGGIEDVARASAGMKDHDLYVLLMDGSRKRVQVKMRTTPGGDRGWWVSKNPIAASDLFYVLVDDSGEVGPAAYIVPSRVVAECVSEIADAKGRRLDRPKICPSFGKLDLPSFQDGWLDDYEDRWDLLDPAEGPLGYCHVEQKKVRMQDAYEITMSDGKPAIKGICPDCGAEISRRGAITDATA